jgi:hypothetical protein
VGVTPEAATLAEATAGRPVAHIRLGRADLREAWAQLSTASGDERLGAVSLGTPHMSLAEMRDLARRLSGLQVARGVRLYVSTSRHVLAELEQDGQRAAFERPGVVLVTDTCTYVTPIIDRRSGAVMTNSAKWAWYAPANLGVAVSFGTLGDCLASAAAGRIIRERPSWLDG